MLNILSYQFGQVHASWPGTQITKSGILDNHIILPLPVSGTHSKGSAFVIGLPLSNWTPSKESGFFGCYVKSTVCNVS